MKAPWSMDVAACAMPRADTNKEPQHSEKGGVLMRAWNRVVFGGAVLLLVAACAEGATAPNAPAVSVLNERAAIEDSTNRDGVVPMSEGNECRWSYSITSGRWEIICGDEE